MIAIRNLFRQDFQHGGYHKFQTMDSLSFIIFYDLCAFWNSYQHSTIMPFYIDWLVASVPFQKIELLSGVDDLFAGLFYFIVPIFIN